MVRDSPFATKEGEAIGAIGWRIIFGGADLVAQTCSHCTDAEDAVVFLKDVINTKIGKKIYDMPNYERWLKIAEKGRTKFNEPKTKQVDFHSVQQAEIAKRVLEAFGIKSNISRDGVVEAYFEEPLVVDVFQTEHP